MLPTAKQAGKLLSGPDAIEFSKVAIQGEATEGKCSSSQIISQLLVG
jgi:hypothetical protein